MTDALTDRLRAAASAGYDEWRVQDPKDGAFCIAYSWPDVGNPEREARDWLAAHKARFPDSPKAGYVVACVRVVPLKDRLLAEAADEIERLRTALAALAVPPGWQPIETAPKDGRKIIVWYLNRNTKARTVMARWLTDEQAAETDGDGVGLEGGWYECIDNWSDYTEVAIHEGEPAHWMPLPAAPTAQQGEQS